jgi:uncharacterized membrane protein HdeD (DUF308 family)
MLDKLTELWAKVCVAILLFVNDKRAKMSGKNWLVLFGGFLVLFIGTALVKDLIGIANPGAAYGIPVLSAGIATLLWVFVVRRYIVKKDAQ